jgi:cbb3-type cytochrome oxidase subunit 3
LIVFFLVAGIVFAFTDSRKAANIGRQNMGHRPILNLKSQLFEEKI